MTRVESVHVVSSERASAERFGPACCLRFCAGVGDGTGAGALVHHSGERAKLEDLHRDKHTKLKQAESDLVRLEQAQQVHRQDVQKLRASQRTIGALLGVLGKRLSLPSDLANALMATGVGDADGIGSMPSPGGQTQADHTAGEALSQLDQAVVAYSAQAVQGADTRWGELVQSLREQIVTHKGGEEEAQRQVEQLSREVKSLKAQLQHLEASTAQQLEAKDRAMASVRQSAELQVRQRETHHGSR